MREFSIALLLLSGVLKAQLKILAPWVPDLTLLAIILVLISHLSTTSRKSLEFTRVEVIGVIIFFIFSLFVIISALYSPSSLINLKFAKFALTIFAFLVALTTKNIDWEKLASYHISLAFVAAIMFIYIFPRFRLGLLGDDASFYRGSYLGFADACAISLVLMQFNRASRPVIVHFLLMLFFVFCMVLSGARGPLIFLALLAGFWSGYAIFRWVINSRSLDIHVLLWVILFAPALTFVLFQTFDFDQFGDADIIKTLGQSIDRLVLLIGDDKGQSVNVRVSHFSQSLAAIDTSSWTGVGFAAYGLSVSGNDIYDYPHNMFLEIWVESGLLALIFLSIFIAVALLTVMLFSPHRWLAFIVVYCLLNALKSSSYVDSRILFFWLGVSIVASGLRFKNNMSISRVRDAF